MRDDWLAGFPRWEGNDLLAGALSTLVAKIASANFFLEGPQDLAETYMNILLEQADFGRGWSSFISKLAYGYLCRDGGGMAERLRASASDHEGPASGFAHLDESRCLYTGDPEYPVIYTNEKGITVRMHKSQVIRITDMPSGKTEDLGMGFCSVSRAISTANILMDLVKYKRERLSDLPPAGILFINNMTESQWEDVVTKYDARQRNQGNTVWKDLLVAVGLDPEYQVGAELFELSKLWDTYDEQTFTELAIFTFSLAFRVDAREFWPVSSGQLGTATEAKVQHLKAKAKGEGIIFTEIERQFNNTLSLPPQLAFKFDFRDSDEDLQQAEIEKAQIANIRSLWESSPNRQALGGRPQDSNDPGRGGRNGRGNEDAGGEGDEETPSADRKERQDGRPQPPVQTRRAFGRDGEGEGGSIEPQNMRESTTELNEGMISTEEARLLLVRRGLIPAEFVANAPSDRSRVYAVRNWGPRVRVSRYGRVERIL
jgi:hypothetical protein